jgi:hypothetical protein
MLRRVTIYLQSKFRFVVKRVPKLPRYVFASILVCILAFGFLPSLLLLSKLHRRSVRFN